jgi:CDP-glycerol glycerophosphotransferase
VKPRLSVVVPLYNVEDYLEECLRSVAGQTMADFEALMVDDGSTDGSPEIAARFARRDPRFRLVRQENAGLSAARNTGVRRCAPGTEFLAFVDSDDVVPPRAYERLIGSLDRTGSDFATGNVWRLDGEGRSQAWQYRWLERSRERTHITRDRRLLADRVAWNKVFRRAFWDRHGFAFPEGKLYEDIPVTIPAHVLARSVDVLHEHIYYWRIREGSITRRRTDVRGVRDRIAACDGVSRFLAERAAAEPGPRWAGFKRAYDIRVLGDDLVYFMEGLPMGGSEYRSAFMTGATDFLSRADPGIITELPVDLRIKWHLVHEQRLAELLELLAFERTNGKTFAVTGRPGRRSARYPRPGGGGIRVSARLARLRRAELPVVARVQEAAWRGGRLRLTGYAYIRNLDVTAARHSLKQALLRSAGGKRIRLLPTRTVSAPEATENSGQRMHCYDLSGFEITIDPAGLRAGGRRRPTTWQLGLMIAGHGVLRRAALRAEDSSSAQPLVHDLDDGTRLVLAYRAGRLELRVQEVAVRVAGHRRVGEDVELSGSVRAGLRPTALRLSHQGTDTAFDYPVVREPGTGRAGWADFSVRLRPADLQGVPPVVSDAPKEVEPLFGDRWQARLVLANGRSRGVTAAPGLGPGRYRGGPGADRELCLTADALGDLVPELTRQPIADRVAWAQDGTVLIEGPVADAGRRRPELVLRHSTRHEEVRVPVEVGDGRFRASLAPAAVPVPGHGTLPLREGRWYAFLRDPGEAAMPVRLLASVHGSLPLRRTAGGREFRLERRFGDRLLIVSGSVLAPLERGAYRRHTLRGSYYPRRRAQPLSDTVLYFDGDAPRAVHEELVRDTRPADAGATDRLGRGRAQRRLV